MMLVPASLMGKAVPRIGSMRSKISTLICAMLLMLPASVATAGGVETLKERLSDKASDDQRVDNCRVPPDRRGPTPRPGCRAPAAAEAAATVRDGTRQEAEERSTVR